MPNEGVAISSQPLARRVKFRWQAPIGCYVVDSLAAASQLVVEGDVGQHTLPGVWSNEVLTNTEGVLEVIRRSLPK